MEEISATKDEELLNSKENENLKELFDRIESLPLEEKRLLKKKLSSSIETFVIGNGSNTTNVTGEIVFHIENARELDMAEIFKALSQRYSHGKEN